MGIKKVKLDYKPVAKRERNEIAYVVSSKHVEAVNRSIKQKIERNILEQQNHSSAKEFICKD